MVGFEEELEDDFSEDVYAICLSRRFIVELWSLIDVNLCFQFRAAPENCPPHKYPRVLLALLFRFANDLRRKFWKI
jgi:hypothetical protein